MSKLPALLALSALALAGAAKAEPLAGSQILERAAGGEFRGDTQSSRGFESHVWRLAAGGQARGVATVKRGLSALNATVVEYTDTGTWHIEGNRLCVAWGGENRRFSGCYDVVGQQGNHVRLVGPVRWEGTLDR